MKKSDEQDESKKDSKENERVHRSRTGKKWRRAKDWCKKRQGKLKREGRMNEQGRTRKDKGWERKRKNKVGGKRGKERGEI